MKYLNSFNENVQPTRWRKYQEISDNLEDILLELKDLGYEFRVHIEMPWNDDPSYIWLFNSQDKIKWEEIEEVIYRINTYIESEGYNFGHNILSLSIDIKNSKFKQIYIPIDKEVKI